MTAVGAGRAARSRLLAPGRLLGVDAARGVALLGMMSVHIIPAVDGDGGVTWAYLIASGRASALFAVLAGLSLVLSTRHPGRAGELVPGARRGLLARAGVIGVIGLTLGALGSGVAVILVHYAVLFAIGTAFLHLRARVLAALAAAWLLLSPVLGHVLRGGLPSGPGSSPSWLSLADPVELATTVLLTGYYPVLQWTSYLLVGVTVGRMRLSRQGTAVSLLLVGTLLAVGSKLLSALLLGLAGGLERLAVPPSSVLFGADLAAALQTGTYGTTPTTTWWWLAVSGPHTGTPLDLLHTTGTSLAVIGGCLLVTNAARGSWRAPILPLAGAGSMTLTLYTGHVLALAVTRAGAPGPQPWAPAEVWLVHAVAALLLASLWQLTGQRGPLEAVAAEMSAAARGPTHEREGGRGP